jgi:hypothetical protein
MTLCKFNVYILTDQQPHWIQCALPTNIYIEKMYMIIWGWLWILLSLNLASILWSFFQIFRSKTFLAERLIHLTETEQEVLARNLTTDGILALRLLKSNTNDFFVNSILQQLSNLVLNTTNKTN